MWKKKTTEWESHLAAISAAYAPSPPWRTLPGREGERKKVQRKEDEIMNSRVKTAGGGGGGEGQGYIGKTEEGGPLQEGLGGGVEEQRGPCWVLLCLFGPPSKTRLTVLPCRARGDMRQDSRPVVRLHFRHPTPEEHFKQSHTVSDRTADPRSEGGAPRKSASLRRNQRMSRLGCCVCSWVKQLQNEPGDEHKRRFFFFLGLFFLFRLQEQSSFPAEDGFISRAGPQPAELLPIWPAGRKHSVNLYRNCV